MVKRKSKKREDVYEMAYSIARAMSRESEAEKATMREKNLAAVALGSLGDLKVGRIFLPKREKRFPTKPHLKDG
jgi:methyl coenzyme M reductase subunit C-like uncharacterized protein (methanogenesis marker protein 7)